MGAVSFDGKRHRSALEVAVHWNLYVLYHQVQGLMIMALLI